MPDYFSRNRSNRHSWVTKFKNAASAQALSLGLSAAESTAVMDLLASYLVARNNATSLRDAAKAATEKQNAQWSEAEAALRGYVQRIKTSPAYTTDVGKLLGIEQEAQTNTQAQLKPVLRPSVNGGSLEIRFNKHGRDAINIYSKRGEETEYSLVATSFKSPFTDKRPNLVPGQPEKRRYMAFYLDGNKQQGDPSAEIFIVI